MSLCKVGQINREIYRLESELEELLCHRSDLGVLYGSAEGTLVKFCTAINGILDNRSTIFPYVFERPDNYDVIPYSLSTVSNSIDSADENLKYFETYLHKTIHGCGDVIESNRGEHGSFRFKFKLGSGFIEISASFVGIPGDQKLKIVLNKQ